MPRDPEQFYIPEQKETQDEEIIHILRLSAGIIRKRGICYGQGTNSKGAVCTLGAIALAYGKNPADWTCVILSPPVLAIKDHLGFTDPYEVSIWNDEGIETTRRFGIIFRTKIVTYRNRTAKEVSNLMLEVANKFENKNASP